MGEEEHPRRRRSGHTVKTYNIIVRQVPLVITFLLACFVHGSGSENEFFSDVATPGMLHQLVVDKYSGRVYVGAADRLYQLSDTLKLEAMVENGPKEDNPNCPPPTSECQCFGSNCKDFEKTMMHSVSKALVIDYRGERLISCTNLYQGHCDKHLLTDIRQTDSVVWTMLVPNDEDSSVVMFVAPGPPNPASTDVLYVAATRSTKGLPAYKDIVPAICMRSLQDLNFVSDDILTPSRIDIEVQQRDLFRVQYVYGFGSLGFSYFLMVQKISAITDSEQYVTQVSRICQSDKSLYSYTEVPLECTHDGVKYNILHAAFLGYPGTNLAKSLGLPHIAPLTDMEHVLIGIFSNQSSLKVGSASSAMCIYPMRDIRRKFTETIQKCFHGTGNTGPDHFVQPKPCYQTPFEIGDDYCGQHDINHPIKGMEPVLGQSIISWNQVNVTSVAVTQTTDFTVAFLGTDDGFLKKVTIESQHSATEYSSTLIERNTLISPSMAFDPKQEHIYIMTDRKVLKIPVQNCSQHVTCQQCLNARDPYCGWCSLERRCSLKSNCSSAETASRWLPYNTGQCPKVVGMASTQAQKQSSSTSVVVISVQNLPLQSLESQSELLCAFRGYGVTRTTKVTLVNGRGSENSTIKCETPTHNLLPPFPTGKGGVVVWTDGDGVSMKRPTLGTRTVKDKTRQDNWCGLEFEDFPELEICGKKYLASSKEATDHIVMNLSLVSDDRDFLSVANFTFFDCSIHNTCTQCTKSSFPCTWCVENHRCTSNKEECNSDVLITGKHVGGHSDTPGPSFCPRIESGTNSTEILISSGSESRLHVRVIHLQDFQSNFKCSFNFNGGVEKNATLVVGRNHETHVECDPVLFQYSGSSQYLNVPFSILWGARRKPLDNPNSIQVRVFKCGHMASNCGRCRSVDLRHGCGWCTGSKRCSIRERCREGSWLGRDQPCPNPSIDQVQPGSGPVDGGTNLTISGENLGVRGDDTTAVVAGIPCQSTSYIEPSEKLVCVTGSSGNVTSGAVAVTISNKYTATSLAPFAYVRPEVIDFSPGQGPQSGGTRLTVFGRSLNAGSNVSVVVTNQTTLTLVETPCTVVSRDVDWLVCITSGTSFPYEADLLQLKIDGATVTYTGASFVFVSDPVVSSVMPEKTIFSGGIKITVTGERLDSVNNPRIIIYLPDRNVSGACDVVNSELMFCFSPSLVSQAPVGLSEPVVVESSLLLLHYGFLMDGVEILQNISLTGVGGEMLIFPDPTFEPFEGGIKQFFYSKNEYLTINGKNLNVVLTKHDFRVTIGDVNCSVTSISSSQLTCLPLELNSILPDAPVKVHVGNSSFHIGALKYDVSQSFITLPVVIAFAVAGGICLLVILIICLAYRSKSKESERVVRQMRTQMDTLEARVANECKEAFAELQTDMVLVSSDICGQGGLPFREYSNFCVRVLFPGDRSSEHPIMRSFDADIPSTETSERGLDMFNQLIGNKTFLLIFIRTLEQHDDFTVREKVNFASLVSVALQNRMEYHTDILKTLLSELIERAINGGRGGRYHPKLLLRRTESVAEKMLTNWFTFLLYKFLRESAGEPMFLLFRAIKQQIEKGPVDALSSEAKYSLSEDKLIRQHINFKVMTLAVIDPETRSSHDVKVLNCDTITQVKEKILDAIYRSAPFSNRPDKDDLDLEWQNRPGGESRNRQILQDEDGTTKLEGDVKRLNTLAHYQVPTEGGRFALVACRSASVVNLALSSEKLPLKFGQDGIYNGSLPHSQSLSMSHTINMSPEIGSRCYHLVKSQESEHSRGENCNKMVSEIYLTRLLATKMALQQFVDNLFETIFGKSNRGSFLPLAIKHLFDFLDDQALHHGITDPEVVHTWKSNCLPLRFWVNVIKNPDFIFDVHKSNIVDSCLSVVAQTFMDSCSMSEHKLSKDSPSSKLLYAKDIPRYKDLVVSYYEDIKKMPSVSEHDLQTMLREESQVHRTEFNTSAAVYELYQYTVRYNDDLMEELNADEFARHNRLSQTLHLVHNAMLEV